MLLPTSLGQDPHRARAGSTLQVWSQAMWDVKASRAARPGPRLSPTPAAEEGGRAGLGVLGGSEALKAGL